MTEMFCVDPLVVNRTSLGQSRTSTPTPHAIRSDVGMLRSYHPSGGYLPTAKPDGTEDIIAWLIKVTTLSTSYKYDSKYQKWLPKV
jgi:hypothetical protein